MDHSCQDSSEDRQHSSATMRLEARSTSMPMRTDWARGHRSWEPTDRHANWCHWRTRTGSIGEGISVHERMACISRLHLFRQRMRFLKTSCKSGFAQSVVGSWAEHDRSAQVFQRSTCSAIASASSTSMLRYLTVLSILVWPSRSCINIQAKQTTGTGYL